MTTYSGRTERLDRLPNRIDSDPLSTVPALGTGFTWFRDCYNAMAGMPVRIIDATTLESKVVKEWRHSYGTGWRAKAMTDPTSLPGETCDVDGTCYCPLTGIIDTLRVCDATHQSHRSPRVSRVYRDRNAPFNGEHDDDEIPPRLKG